jgi:RNA-directed DNA polymerase
MKRYGNLYPKVYEMGNIELAHKNARKGKIHYKEVKKVDSKPGYYFDQIQRMLKEKTFQNSEYEVFRKVEGGKEREIFRLPYFPDRIIHHSIMQILYPIWTKTLISDTYACIKSRGIHKGVSRIKQALLDIENTVYCLKCDIRKFYPSVNHDILKNVIRKKIKDRELLWLLDHIIDSAPGIPIGNYLSQHFGNLYLSELDHWAKEARGCRYYFRYADDIVVLHKAKSFLHNCRANVSEYLQEHLALTMKPDWQVFPVDSRGIDFLGYRFFHGYVLLRKSIAQRIKRKTAKVRKNWESMEPSEVVSGVMSYYGWMKHANCLNLTRSYFDEDMSRIIGKVCLKSKYRNPLRRINWMAA